MGTRACRMRSTWPWHSRLAWMREARACGTACATRRRQACCKRPRSGARGTTSSLQVPGIARADASSRLSRSAPPPLAHIHTDTHPQELDLHLPLHAVDRDALHPPGLVPPAGAGPAADTAQQRCVGRRHRGRCKGASPKQTRKSDKSPAPKPASRRRRASRARHGLCRAVVPQQAQRAAPQPTRLRAPQCSGPGPRWGCTARSQRSLRRDGCSMATRMAGAAGRGPAGGAQRPAHPAAGMPASPAASRAQAHARDRGGSGAPP